MQLQMQSLDLKLNALHRLEVVHTEMIWDVSLAMFELHLLSAKEVEARVAWPRDQANLSRGGGATSSAAAADDEEEDKSNDEEKPDNDEEEGSDDDSSARSEDNVSRDALGADRWLPFVGLVFVNSPDFQLCF